MISRLKTWLLNGSIKHLAEKKDISRSQAEDLVRMVSYRDKGYW
jgi:hypothetical protein